MSIRLAYLAACESARKLSGPTFADIRINQLTVRIRTWSGPVVGAGTSTDVDLVLAPHYRVSGVTSQDVSASGGRYEIGDISVNHITPSNGAGVGYTTEQLHPTTTARNVEIIYVITGTHPGEYECIDLQNYRAFSTRLILRRLSR